MPGTFVQTICHEMLHSRNDEATNTFINSFGAHVMPKRNISFVEGEYYHVMNRGSLRHPLFLDDSMYSVFLQVLEYYAKVSGITIVSLCLMPNHFHLLVRIEAGGNLSGFMQKACCRFSNRVNRMLRRSGTMFQGRFVAKHVSSDSYFRALCRYIHLNPVEAGICTRPEDYAYSTYKETIGKRVQIGCDPRAITQMFGGVDNYVAFVASGVHDPKIIDADFLRDLGRMKLK